MAFLLLHNPWIVMSDCLTASVPLLVPYTASIVKKYSKLVTMSNRSKIHGILHSFPLTTCRNVTAAGG